MKAKKDVSTMGFRVVTQVERIPKEILEGFQGCSSTAIADVVGKMFTMSSGIKPLYAPIQPIVGSAVTVRVPPGDNLMTHIALSYMQEGDVLVVDARGDMEYCLGGALMGAIAKGHGVKGFVLDGAYRDMEELKGIDFPVFALGLQAKPSPRKVGPGEINTVIDCGGVPVRPGDVIVADEEGIVVIPLEYAEAVLEKVRQRIQKDVDRWNDLDKFESDHKINFDKILVDSGCEVE